MLVAMVPREDRIWFFKIDGPAPHVLDQKQRFEEFVKSLSFPSGKPVWKAPAEWKEIPGSGMRFASFEMGPPESPLVMTVIPLDKAGQTASVSANVQRWREQMGLAPVEEGQVSKYVRDVTVDGQPAAIVELVAPETETPARKRVGYSVPSGWKELPASGMRAASLEIVEGGDRAEATIVPLAGTSGTLLENVNRWRGQVGLAEIGEEELKKGMREIEVDGTRSPYVQLVGAQQAILGVIVPREGRTWFLKLQGPAALVGARRGEFEEFVRSVKIDP
jgi:hypothetical protein